MSSCFLDTLRSRVLLCDGAIGTLIQARYWDVDNDVLGRENGSEILNLTLPNSVEATHVAYVEAAPECV